MLPFVIAACASSTPRASERPRQYSTVITADEIGSKTWTSAYDVVNTLRRNWLHYRGDETFVGEQSQLQVLFNGVRESGGVEVLRRTPAEGIVAIRYYDPITASSRWGGDFRRGAIEIQTRPR